MPKSIVIFSDGTGQRGGILFDENRSNIYKLYRGARCGPDTSIDANAQLAYYDPGIGSAPAGLGFLGAMWRKIQNIVSQATGLGLTLNIVDCYAEIVKVWEPGDRIYVFGFSRGASPPCLTFAAFPRSVSTANRSSAIPPRFAASPTMRSSEPIST